MWNQFCTDTFSFEFGLVFADSQGIGLREEVGHKLIMIIDWFSFNLKRSLRFGKANEFYWDNSTLMKKLEETMLSICAWLSKIDHPCLVLNCLSLLIDPFPIALHVQLLDMWGKL